jgi:phosphoglycerate dehydrogenase-like enzyme
MNKKIGQLIRERVEALNMEVTAFAKAINKERSNVYDIFKRDSIDTKLLKKIGHVLDYDFFQNLLEEETIEKLKIDEAVRKSRVLIEVELKEDEIINLGFNERVFRILNK